MPEDLMAQIKVTMHPDRYRNRDRDREKPAVLPLAWSMKDDFDSDFDPETFIFESDRF